MTCQTWEGIQYRREAGVPTGLRHAPYRTIGLCIAKKKKSHVRMCPIASGASLPRSGRRASRTEHGRAGRELRRHPPASPRSPPSPPPRAARRAADALTLAGGALGAAPCGAGSRGGRRRSSARSSAEAPGRCSRLQAGPGRPRPLRARSRASRAPRRFATPGAGPPPPPFRAARQSPPVLPCSPQHSRREALFARSQAATSRQPSHWLRSPADSQVLQGLCSWSPFSGSPAGPGSLYEHACVKSLSLLY